MKNFSDFTNQTKFHQILYEKQYTRHIYYDKVFMACTE